MNRLDSITALANSNPELSSRDVPDLVDQLLGFCRRFRVCLVWRNKQFIISGLADRTQEAVPATWRKSVQRAILARVAVLCNERQPNSVSPYTGEGELVGGQPPGVFRVRFTNTADVAELEIMPISAPIERSNSSPKAYVPIDELAISIISHRAIAQRIREFGQIIGEGAWNEPLSFFWIANGALFFAGDLIREVRRRKQNILVESIRARSYDKMRSGELRVDMGLVDFEEHRGRRIILLDDVLDSGKTLAGIQAKLTANLPAEQVVTMALVHKEGCQEFAVTIDHVGFSIGRGENGQIPWLIGAGMDDNGYYRNERSIWVKRIEGWPRRPTQIPITVDGIPLDEWTRERVRA